VQVKAGLGSSSPARPWPASDTSRPGSAAAVRGGDRVAMAGRVAPPAVPPAKRDSREGMQRERGRAWASSISSICQRIPTAAAAWAATACGMNRRQRRRLPAPFPTVKICPYSSR
jgi:hypothetical protein